MAQLVQQPQTGKHLQVERRLQSTENFRIARILGLIGGGLGATVGGFYFLVGATGFLLEATNEKANAAGLIGLVGGIVALGSLFGIVGAAMPIARRRLAAGPMLVAVVLTFTGATILAVSEGGFYAGYLLPGLWLVAAVLAFRSAKRPTTQAR